MNKINTYIQHQHSSDKLATEHIDTYHKEEQ